MNAKIISDSRVLPFPADAIFDVLASPAGHVEMDGSGTVRGVASGPERLRDGARFRMKMKLGVPYQMSSTVREFEENRRIAWAHVGGHRWRYELEEVDGGTRVTESFDWSTSRPASSRWSAIRSGTRPICRRPSSDSKRSLPGVRLDRREASVETGGVGRPFGRKRLECAEVDGRTRELPGPGGGDDSRRQWRGRRSDHDRR